MQGRPSEFIATEIMTWILRTVNVEHRIKSWRQKAQELYLANYSHCSKLIEMAKYCRRAKVELELKSINSPDIDPIIFSLALNL